jgi:O-antigen/teichoic acid export membrane protein
MRTRLRSLASDSVVYGLSDVISRFLTIFLVPIYTRLFTPADYGVLSLVSASLAVVSTFVVLGLDNSAHRWYWDKEDEVERHRTIASWTWCQISVSTLFAAMIFLAADWLGRLVFKHDGAGIYFRLAALTLPLAVLGRVTTGWMRMQRRPWSTTFYALGTNLVTILATLLLVVAFRWGLVGVYVGQIIAYAAGTVAGAVLLKSWILPKYFTLERLSEMLRFSLPLIPGAVAYWVVGFADRYFVEAYTTTSEVGLYSVGSQIAALVALATGAFQMAWGPFAFSIHKEPTARRTYADVFLLYLWGGTALSAGLSLFAPEAIRLVATRQYSGASTVVGVLALSYVMIGLTYIASTGPSIAKQTRPVGIAMAGAAILNIILNFALVPRFGKVGSAVATLISQTLTPAYLFFRSQRIYPIPYRFRTGITLLVATLLVMAIGAWMHMESEWMMIIVKLALMLIYVPLFFVLGLATPDEVAQLLSRTLRRMRHRVATSERPSQTAPPLSDTP